MNNITWKINRETSKYNKYMKWHLELFRTDNSRLSSMFFKTRKEAIASIERSIYRGNQGFPIGDSIYYTEYIQAN